LSSWQTGGDFLAGATGNYTDSLVVVYDENDNFITKKIITGHNTSKKFIEFQKGEEDIKPGTRLHLVIVHSEGVSVYNGKLSIVFKGSCEISLFGERPRDARGSERHALNIDAIVTAFIVNSRQEPLSVPLFITIENISTTGVLVKTIANRFELGTILQVEFSINDKTTILYGKVVREQRHDDITYSFGCQLVFRK